MIGTYISFGVMLIVGLFIFYDFHHDNIPCVIYVWDPMYRDKIPVFYTTSYRKAKKVQAQMVEFNDKALTFSITEAWHNPDIPGRG